MQKLVLLLIAMSVTANGLQFIEDAVVWEKEFKLAWRFEYDAGVTTIWGGSNM